MHFSKYFTESDFLTEYIAIRWKPTIPTCQKYPLILMHLKNSTNFKISVIDLFDFIWWPLMDGSSGIKVILICFHVYAKIFRIEIELISSQSKNSLNFIWINIKLIVYYACVMYLTRCKSRNVSFKSFWTL